METSFHKETYEARILDPSGGFEEKRYDSSILADCGGQQANQVL